MPTETADVAHGFGRPDRITEDASEAAWSGGAAPLQRPAGNRWLPPAVADWLEHRSFNVSDHKRTVAAGAVVLLLVVLAVRVIGGGTHTLTGTFELTSSSLGFYTDQPTCSGYGGYGDIQSGTEVAVYDGGGKVLGQGSLGAGQPGSVDWGKNRSYTCTFEFKIPDLPKSDFYKIEVSSRGDLLFAYEELEQQGWSIGASLGD